MKAVDARSPSSEAPFIELEGVDFSYDGKPVLRDVSLRVCAGESLGVVGPNGGGKSTLLRLILGLLKPERGRVRLFGDVPEAKRMLVGYMPQKVALPRNFPATVEDAVRSGRIGCDAPGSARTERAIVRESLELAGFAQGAQRRLSQLSGGELQRVLLARALACRPRLLLLDEPITHIEPGAGAQFFKLLECCSWLSVIVVVSHDISFISEHFRKVACVNRELVCHDTSALEGRIMEQLYGAPVRLIRHQH